MPICQPISSVALLGTVLILPLLATLSAGAQEPPPWKTGAAFRQQLDQPAGIAWQDRPLREGLVRLSTAYGLAIFLDRRIDPGNPISLTLRDQPVSKLLAEIGNSAAAKMTILGPVVYLGPSQSASQLAALAASRKQEIAKLPTDARTRLQRSAAWQWDELAQPRQLLDDLARQASISIQNPDAIPLDLWPAVSLPVLPWADRMTLLLAGFGLTFEIDPRGASIRLVPAPLNSAAVTPAPKMASRTPRNSKSSGQKVYTLKVENESAGKVVKTIASSIGRELQYDPSALEKLNQQVSLNVKDVPLNQLLEAALKPVGLTYRLSDATLEIRLAP